MYLVKVESVNTATSFALNSLSEAMTLAILLNKSGLLTWVINSITGEVMLSLDGELPYVASGVIER